MTLILIALYLILGLCTALGYFLMIRTTDSWKGQRLDFMICAFTGLIWPAFLAFALHFVITNRS